MQRYLNHAILWDLIITIILGALAIVLLKFTKNPVVLPSEQNLIDFGVSMITISATLLGFLLTIITVIVTFKKGFSDTQPDHVNTKSDNEIPDETVFNSKPDKEAIFYKTPIYERVIVVFLQATYEIGLVLLILLLIQLRIINMTLEWNFILNAITLLLLVLSIIRSLYTFRLFLKVHA